MLHCSFITSLACLWAQMFFIELPDKTPRSNEFKKHCGDLASQFKMAEFVPNEAKAQEIQKSVNKADAAKEESKNEEEDKPEEEDKEEEVNLDDVQKQKEEFLGIFKGLTLDKKKKFDEYLVHADEF